MFGDMIVDMESNKKVSSIVNELFLGGKKLNISLVFQYLFDNLILKSIKLLN